MTNAYTFQIKWPLDGKEIIIRVEPKDYKRNLIYRPTQFLNYQTVYEVLHNPNRIFSGLNRPYSDSSKKLCVVGKPRYWYIGKSGNDIQFPPELVYLVFLSERKSVFEFGSEQADIEDPLSPIDWKDRYGKLIWKKTS